MDYLQIYKNQFEVTWEHIKNKTIDDLKTAKKNKRNFNTLFNNITATLYEEQKKIIEDFKVNNLTSCFELFEKRHSFYYSSLERNEVISLVLRNEIKEEFSRLGRLDYKEFIKTLAKQQAIDKIRNHFSQYVNYYELIYEQDKYEYFYAKKFENNINYRDSREFREMLHYKFPPKKDVLNKGEISIIEETQKPTVLNITTRQRLRNEFDVNERAVLIHLLKNRLKLGMLDSTELMKLVLIIGATDKFEIFDVKYASNSYFYKKAIKGYSVFKRNDQQKRIASLKAKLEINGLKSIAEELSTDYGDFFKKLK